MSDRELELWEQEQEEYEETESEELESVSSDIEDSDIEIFEEIEGSSEDESPGSEEWETNDEKTEEEQNSRKVVSWVQINC